MTAGSLAAVPSSILVIETAFLGDTVFSSGLVDALGARWPSARLCVCVAPRGLEVARAMPRASDVVVFDKRGADRGWAGLRAAARRTQLAAGAVFDLAVLPHRSLRSGLLALLAGARVRVGLAGAAQRLLLHRRAPEVGEGFLGPRDALAAAVGAAPLPPRLVATPAQVAQAAQALGEGGEVAALCIGSEWETKVWPAERFGRVAATLAGRGLRPVLLGGPRERGWARAAQASSGGVCLDLVGGSIAQALGVLSRAALVVGGDSGLLHAARALGRPCVVLFGPTSPAPHRFGPRELPLWLGLSCSPCSAHGPRRCPLEHHRCLRDLGSAAVEDACRAVLS